MPVKALLLSAGLVLVCLVCGWAMNLAEHVFMSWQQARQVIEQTEAEAQDGRGDQPPPRPGGRY